MESPLQKKDTGKIKSKAGHMEPASKGPMDFKSTNGGSTEIHGNQRIPNGHPTPATKGDPTLPGDPLMREVASEMSGKRGSRADAMDAAHMRGKKDITKAANEE